MPLLSCPDPDGSEDDWLSTEPPQASSPNPRQTAANRIQYGKARSMAARVANFGPRIESTLSCEISYGGVTRVGRYLEQVRPRLARQLRGPITSVESRY